VYRQKLALDVRDVKVDLHEPARNLSGREVAQQLKVQDFVGFDVLSSEGELNLIGAFIQVLCTYGAREVDVPWRLERSNGNTHCTGT
jgi:hypothetical protein